MQKFTKPSAEDREGTIAFFGGTYAVILTALVTAILIMVNVFVNTIPASMTKMDISSSRLYSITSNTKVVLNNLTEDVTIYWIVQAGEEDDILQNLLDKYESLSSHIKVVKKNPDAFPTFTAQYTEETVNNNSLIVECEDKYRFIPDYDIYVTETDMYSYYYDSETFFDGEGAITSAIDYVVSDDLPKIYLLEGHGEAALPATFTEQMDKENMETETFSLLNVDAIPEDADCILIHAPESDISENEKEMLAEYTANGGKLLVFAGPVESGTMTNLYSLLADYGVTAEEGIVVDLDREHYAFSEPLILLPDIQSSHITDSLIEENYLTIVTIAQGLSVTGSSNGATVTELLTTSNESFSKVAGYMMTTYEKEDGDIDGPFAVAVSVETETDGGIVWFTTSLLLDEQYNAYSSGGNGDIAMNALSNLIGESEAVAIRSKSLDYNYLTISEQTASTLKILMIGAFPLCYLGIGLIVMLRRRKSQS